MARSMRIETDAGVDTANRDLTGAEQLAITNQRGLERTGILVARGLDFEDDILTALRDPDTETGDATWQYSQRCWRHSPSDLRPQPDRHR